MIFNTIIQFHQELRLHNKEETAYSGTSSAHYS